jgi:signal transduction histidine kinase
MTTTTAPTGNPVTRMLRQLGADSMYLIVGFPVALVAFILCFTLFWLGVGTAVIVIGIPIMVGSLYLARGFADIERLRIPAVLRRPAPRPRYRRAEANAGFWRRVATPLRDGQSWLDLMHACLAWILSTIGFSFIVTWWAGALGGLTYFAWDWALPRPENNTDLNELMGISDTYTARVGLYTLAGVFFLITLPLVARIFALLTANLGRALLSGLAEVQERITDLDEQRTAAVAAEATALRRLERDIHDGPQQRLVRLAMDLGRARHQLDTDPAAARATLDEAVGQTRETLDELRALSRGIAPPILADRGLPSALAALGGRCTVPVHLRVDSDLGRLAPITENTAYFVVAEALTNIAKHSHARSCSVGVTLTGRRLAVTIEDNGLGGAHPAKGHGLAGLADRVRAAGGTLHISSPAGGPTLIRAELPAGRPVETG